MSVAGVMPIACCWEITKWMRKDGEIPAIPKLLEMLDLTGYVITIDAMGCQTEIAEQIVDHQAHYILTMGDKEAHLLDDVKEAFADERPAGVILDVQTGLGHGGIEKRTCRVITDPDWICKSGKWKSLSSLVELTTERTDKITGA